MQKKYIIYKKKLIFIINIIKYDYLITMFQYII